MTFEDCKNAGSCGKDLCLPEFCDQFDPKQKTDADRIRAMSDRELAEFLSGMFSEVGCEEHNLSAIQLEALKHNLFCIFMNWLKQPADKEV